MEVEGKVAVVTGGASGIGRGIGFALAEKGAHVVVADVEKSRAEAVAADIASEGVRTLAVHCDVTDLASVERMAEEAWRELGHVDLLFNNAGVTGGTFLLDSTAADMRWIFAVNLFGVWHGCQAFGRRFRDQGTPAWIVNTGSEHSIGVPHVQTGFYTASKHAVLALSDVLRRELPPHVGVSVLCPGVVQSELWNAARNRPESLGGPAEPEGPAKLILERGIDPLTIGRRAVEGVERGDFFIVTHPHARTYAEERHRELMAAFDAQAPFREGDDRYDVSRIVMDIVAEAAGEKEH